MNAVPFISPYAADRQEVCAFVNPDDFIEICCRCPVKVYEARDPKGNYAKARSGVITPFTGISAPYQAPLTPDMVVDTDQIGIEESIMVGLALVHQRGVIERNSSVHAL